MNICFIADYFVYEIPGGGELNNQEFVKIAKSRGHNVEETKSISANVGYLESLIDYKFIVGNFVELSEKSKSFLADKTYVIYEHDHKYLEERNPAIFKDFKAPKDEIINRSFYENATAILCQSKFHKEIIEKNLGLDNIINLSGNIWSKNILNLIEEYSNNKKENRYAIMDSIEPHKNTRSAIKYCQHKNLKYDLIPHCKYKNFLGRLSHSENFMFFPQTPETLSRVVVEARMLGMKVTTNKLVGATGEEWFKLRGKELIDLMRQKRETIVDLVLEKLDENTFSLK